MGVWAGPVGSEPSPWWFFVKGSPILQRQVSMPACFECARHEAWREDFVPAMMTNEQYGDIPLPCTHERSKDALLIEASAAFAAWVCCVPLRPMRFDEEELVPRDRAAEARMLGDYTRTIPASTVPRVPKPFLVGPKGSR